MSFTVGKFLRMSLFPLVILQGCALTDAHIDLAYLPATGAKSPLGTINSMQVVLQIEDQRPAGERQWVGNKRNGYGMVTAWIKSNKEVPSVVYDALKNEFVSNGHKVVDAKETPSNVAIVVALKKYWSDISIGFWNVDVIGTLHADVTVRDPGKDLALPSRSIQATFREGHAIATDGAYEGVLNGALIEFIRSFSRDPNILNALRLVLQEKGDGKGATSP